MPFERVEQYQARRVRDRFTLDMWLVEKTGSFVSAQNEYTLAEARGDIL